MLQQVLSEENIQRALRALKEKPDTAGIDGVRLSDLPEYWKLNRERITLELSSASYIPGLISKREIVSPNGKRRNIVLINAVDRLLLRAMFQVLNPVIDSCLSDHCYAFRTGKGVQEAAKAAAGYMEEGKRYVAEIDVQSFFDSIPIGRLMQKTIKIIDDDTFQKVLLLFLTAKVDDFGVIKTSEKGILQGSPLSPLLANLYLSEFDHFLESRGCAFYRYGDDINIYCNSYEEALEQRRYAEGVLKQEGLTLHPDKGGVFLGKTRQCLGYEFCEKNGRIFISRAVKRRNPVYHRWQRSSLQFINNRYHLINSGVISRRDFTILFENPEGKKYLPVEAVDGLNVFSDVTFTSGFFEYANRTGLKINIIDKAGESVGTYVPQTLRKNYAAEMEQILLLRNEKEHLRIAKAYQNANIFNLRAVLRYYERRGGKEQISQTISFMTELLIKINEAKTTESLMIYEAQARQKYYKCFNEILNEEGFCFTTRSRRPPRDALNAMISFGNTMLYQQLAGEIRMTSLDIRFGILHNSKYRAESLNLDLADLFKPVIVDRTIFTLVNRKMISPYKDFKELENGGVYLNETGRYKFIREFENKLSTQIKTGKAYKTYHELLREEVRKIESFFRKKEAYKPYKYVN